MAMIDTTEFTSYVFSTEDYAVAYTYTELQLKGIQTQLCKFAQQKLNLAAADFDTDETYIRAHEYNRGLMDAMRYLLELHNSQAETVKEMNEAAAEARRREEAQEIDWSSLRTRNEGF